MIANESNKPITSAKTHRSFVERGIIQDYQLHIIRSEAQNILKKQTKTQRNYNLTSWFTIATCEDLFGAQRSNFQQTKRHLFKHKIATRSTTHIPKLIESETITTVHIHPYTNNYDPASKFYSNCKPKYKSVKGKPAISTEVHNRLFLKTFTTMRNRIKEVPNPSTISYKNNAYRKIFNYQSDRMPVGRFNTLWLR